MADGSGYRIDGIVDSYRAPFYPYLLSLIYYVTSGDPYRLTTLIQSFLSALTCVFIFLLAANVWNRKIGITAGILAVCCPDLILYNSYLLTEVIFMFVMVIVIWYLYKANDKTISWILAAILLGLSALTRPTVILFLPFILLWFYLKKKLKFYKLVIFPLITFAVILPWTMRNYQVNGVFMPLTSAAGVNFWLGNNEKATGVFRWIEEGNPYLNENYSIAERNSKCYAEAMSFITQNPVKELRILALKTIFFITPAGDKYPVNIGFLTPVTMFIITGIFFEFLVLGSVSLAFSKSNKGTSLLWFYILSIYVTVFVFFFQDRFRITAYLTLIPLAAAGWVYLAEKNGRNRKILIMLSFMFIQLILCIVALILRPDFMDSYLKISDKLPFLTK